MPTGRIKAPKCNWREAVIATADPRFDLRGILQTDHGHDKCVSQSGWRWFRSGCWWPHRKMIDRPRSFFLPVIAFWGRASLECGAAERFRKSNGFLMFDQTFETRLREIEFRVEPADDDCCEEADQRHVWCNGDRIWADRIADRSWLLDRHKRYRHRPQPPGYLWRGRRQTAMISADEICAIPESYPRGGRWR